MDELDEFQALVRAAFMEESADLVCAMDVALQHLQLADGDGAEQVVVVKRALHTLKGSAAAAGQAPVATFVHSWESDLEEGGFGPEAQLERLDQLRAILDGQSSAEVMPPPDATPRPTPPPEAPQVAAPPTQAAPAPPPEGAKPLVVAERAPTPRPVPSPNARAADLRVPSGRIQELDRALGDHLVLHLRSRQQLTRTVHTRDRLGDVMRCHRALRDAMRSLRRSPSHEEWERVEGLFEQLGRPLREVYRDTWQDVRAESARLDQGANVGFRLRHSVRSLGLMPVQPVLEDLGRVVRHAAKVAGCRVALEVANSPVHIERLVLEQLADPLQHLVRNAVAHGVEAPEDRERVGKDPVGRVTLQAEGTGATAVIRVSDDGGGVDAEAVNARARQLGLGEASDAAGLLRILTTPGLTTRASADDIAGRGVGMDVVASRIAELGGQLTLENRPGKGCTFTLTVPVRSRSDRGLIVDVSGARYALPQGRIERVVRLDPGKIRTLQGAEVVDFGGPVSVLSLASLIGGRAAPLGQDTVEGLLLRHGADRLVLLVDEILNEQTLVVRPLPPAFAASTLLDGGALQPDGTAIPVLSVRGLLEHARGRPSTGLRQQVQAARERHVPRALVVDDSITMRTLQRNILHAAGYRVEVANDGRHGLEVLTEQGPFDVLVVDLEMPRMNGPELCRAVRASSELADLPIVMVTSVSDPVQRAAALQAGADDYIVKGHFEQGAFLACVSQLVGGERLTRILLVDDSKVLCSYVSAMLSRVPDTQVLPPVHDGVEAVGVVMEQRPDVVLMDIQLPGQSGLAAIRQILATRHVPIVVLSSYVDDPSRNLVFEALSAGAIEVLAKPRGTDRAAYNSFRERLLQAVDVARRAKISPPFYKHREAPVPSGRRVERRARLVAIGSSTGGPAALQRLLGELPAPFPAPVVVAQHILQGFDVSLARWLSSVSGHEAAIVEEGMVPTPGQVLIAPAQRDIEWRDGRLRVSPSSGRWRPSVDRFFHSVARELGSGAVGVLLTGMGSDGAEGLAAMREAGARTYAQSADSCVVDGMPGSARRLGAVEQSASPAGIGRVVRALVGVPA